MLSRLVANSRTSRINLGADCCLLVVASVVATTARPWSATFAVLGAASFVWLVGARVLRHYDARRAQQGLPGDVALTSLLVLASTCAVLLLGLFAVAERPLVGRFLLALWPAAVWVRTMLPGARVRLPSEPDDVLVVGSGLLGRHTGIAIAEAGRTLCGYLSLPADGAPDRLPAGLLGASADLERVLCERPVREVYLASHAPSDADAMQAAIRVCERFGVPFALPASQFRLDRARPADGKAIPDGYVHFLSYERHPIQMRIKRLFDIVASSAALTLLLPLFLGVAAIIKLTSAGPVLFKQERVGQHGRPFHMLKFRSMVVNAEELKARLVAQNEQAGPVFKMKRDPRVTWIGRFIRKFSIDELPQLINVLRGEMSIVGPRPPIPSEVAKYEAWQRRRLSVRPGLTCVWQVSGRNHISFETWMYLDMQYIDHWSLKEDFRLILKTVPVVLTGRGAS
jgi:exopolysaccharide biosynthesis polyprenyl glycosylphosphotransferase